MGSYIKLYVKKFSISMTLDYVLESCVAILVAYKWSLQHSVGDVFSCKLE